MPVYVLGIGLWPGLGGLNIGASGGEDRCAACRGGGHSPWRNEHVTEGSSVGLLDRDVTSQRAAGCITLELPETTEPD